MAYGTALKKRLAELYRNARDAGDNHPEAIAAAVDGYRFSQLTGVTDQGRDLHADADADAYYAARAAASPLAPHFSDANPGS